MAFNVLLVDDSASMRAVIKKTIKVCGFNVGEYWEAANGRQAMEVLRGKWVDIVLADINMPTMNGLELLAEIKGDELLSSIPVVMVTTEGSEKRMQECMRLGASGYIKKPFVPKEIKKTLRSVMGLEEDVQREHDEEYDEGDF